MEIYHMILITERRGINKVSLNFAPIYSLGQSEEYWAEWNEAESTVSPRCSPTWGKRDQSWGAKCLVKNFSLMNGWINKSLWVFCLGEQKTLLCFINKVESIEAQNRR